MEVCFERHLIPKIWADMSGSGKFLNEFGYVATEKHLEFSDEVRRKIVEKGNNTPPLHAGRVKCRFVSEPAGTEKEVSCIPFAKHTILKVGEK